MLRYCLILTLLTLTACASDPNKPHYRMSPEAFIDEYMKNHYTAIKKFSGKRIRFDGILKRKVGEDIDGIFAVEFYGMDDAQAYESGMRLFFLDPSYPENLSDFFIYQPGMEISLMCTLDSASNTPIVNGCRFISDLKQ
ncbi:MAG: hypothetical protein KC900_08515 [Candidatus Omnitrophica bacterium]|nr:hypothetical protein [Candidatus Omnitrophota bacterium]